MLINNLLSIEEVLVRDEILNTRFACDLEKCKGACCTIDSEFGATTNFEEVMIIESFLDEILNYLDDVNKEAICNNGFYEIKFDEYFLKSIDNKQCVFVYYENGVARCAIERAYLDNKINFRKPISCHLFPIRVSNFGGDILRYEKFKECEPALENGKLKDLTIAQFCKDALIRLYGENWYLKLSEKFNR